MAQKLWQFIRPRFDIPWAGGFPASIPGFAFYFWRRQTQSMRDCWGSYTVSTSADAWLIEHWIHARHIPLPDDCPVPVEAEAILAEAERLNGQPYYTELDHADDRRTALLHNLVLCVYDRRLAELSLVERSSTGSATPPDAL